MGVWMKVQGVCFLAILLTLWVGGNAKAANNTNVLVLGQFGGRYETVMVSTYTSGTATPRIISIPPGAVFLDGPQILRTKAITMTLQDEGILPVMKALGSYFNLELNSYIVINYDGAQGVVDAMGGVDFTLTRTVQLPAANGEPALELKAGLRHLDGKTSRRFLRYRTGDLYSPAELQVIQMQQLFLDAMIRKLAHDKSKILPVAWKLPHMLSTNLSITTIVNLGYEAIKIDPEDLQVKFGTVPGKFVASGGSYHYQIQGAKNYHLP